MDREKQNRLIDLIGIPPSVIADVNEGNYNPELVKEIYDSLKTKSVYVHGDVGVGKTVAAAATMIFVRDDDLARIRNTETYSAVCDFIKCPNNVEHDVDFTDFPEDQTHSCQYQKEYPDYTACLYPKFNSPIEVTGYKFVIFNDLLYLSRLQISQKEDFMELINEHRKASKLLVLDDIGVEKSSDWVNQVAYELIDYRCTHNLKTIYTSNLNLKKLTIKFGPRITSRIMGSCACIEVTGKDRRLDR